MPTNDEPSETTDREPDAASRGTSTSASQPRVGVAFETALVGITQVLTKLRALIMLPLIAGRLGETQYGLLTQVLAMTTLLAQVTGLSIHTPLIRYGAERRARLGELYTTYVLLVVALMAAMLLVVDRTRRGMAFVFFDDASAEGFVMSAVALVFAANLRQVTLGLYRVQGRIWLVTGVQLLVSVVAIVVLCGRLLVGDGLEASIRIWAVVELGFASLTALHGFVSTRFGRPTLDALRIGLRLALPLIPAQLGLFVIDRFDRFALAHFRDLGAVGIYSAQYSVASLLLLVVTPLSTVIMPRISGVFATDRERAFGMLDASLDLFLVVAAVFVTAAPFLGGPLLVAVGRESLARDAFASILVLSFGATAWGFASLQVMGLYLIERTDLSARANAIGAIVNAVVCIATIPRFGLLGAGSATLVAFVTVALIQRRALTSEWPGPPRSEFVARCTLAAAPHAIALVYVQPTSLAEVVLAGLGCIVSYASFAHLLGVFARPSFAWLRRAG